MNLFWGGVLALKRAVGIVLTFQTSLQNHFGHCTHKSMGFIMRLSSKTVLCFFLELGFENKMLQIWINACNKTKMQKTPHHLPKQKSKLPLNLLVLIYRNLRLDTKHIPIKHKLHKKYCDKLSNKCDF